jgi:hypothetical protein
VWKVAVERWRTAGIAGFYSGVIVSVIRAFFVSSSRFAAYEVAVSLISSLDHSSEAERRDPSLVE